MQNKENSKSRMSDNTDVPDPGTRRIPYDGRVFYGEDTQIEGKTWKKM